MYGLNLDSCISAKTPEIGMPCTICYVTDSRPAEVVAIRKDGKEIDIRDMDYKLIKGDVFSGAEYEYTSNPNNGISTYTLRKNGRYIRKGEPLRGGSPLSLGFARYYYDPHF